MLQSLTQWAFNPQKAFFKTLFHDYDIHYFLFVTIINEFKGSNFEPLFCWGSFS